MDTKQQVSIYTWLSSIGKTIIHYVD